MFPVLLVSPFERSPLLTLSHRPFAVSCLFGSEAVTIKKAESCHGVSPTRALLATGCVLRSLRQRWRRDDLQASRHVAPLVRQLEAPGEAAQHWAALGAERFSGTACPTQTSGCSPKVRSNSCRAPTLVRLASDARRTVARQQPRKRSSLGNSHTRLYLLGGFPATWGEVVGERCGGPLSKTL